MKGLRAALLTAAGVLTCAVFGLMSAEKPQYQVRKDLSFYFSNSDSVIISLRQMLRDRAPGCEICFTTHGDGMEDIYGVFSELMHFAQAETEDPREGDYLRYQCGGFRLEYSCTEAGGEYRYSVEVIPDMYTTRKQERRVDEAVEEAVMSFGFTEDTGEREKIDTVYRYVLSKVDADTINARHSAYKRKNTAYGALINGHASCQGYAVLMYRLLRECGVDCRVVTGTATKLTGGEEFHAWNRVCVDGEYYDIDSMWCDLLGTDEYYMVPEGKLRGHTHGTTKNWTEAMERKEEYEKENTENTDL